MKHSCRSGLWLALLFSLGGSAVFADGMDNSWSASIQYGSLRPSYSFLTSVLTLTGPVLSQELPLQVQFSLHSWGVFYFLNPAASDFLLLARYNLYPRAELGLSPLLGGQVDLRSQNDVRSTAATVFAPVVGLEAHYRRGWLDARCRLESLWYADGIILRQSPELTLPLGWVALLLRAEFSQLLGWAGQGFEGRVDSYVGVRVGL